DFAISRRISLIADNSLASRAASDSRPAAVDLRGGAGLAPPQSLGAVVFRRFGLRQLAPVRGSTGLAHVCEVASCLSVRPQARVGIASMGWPSLCHQCERSKFLFSAEAWRQQI